MQKSARFTEEALHQLGLTVVGNEAVPLGEAVPDESWELDRLAVYAKGELTNSKTAEDEAILQSRKSAVHLFRAGCALHFARAVCKADSHGAWVKWKQKHGLADTTVNDAIRLYEKAKTEDALIGLGITEAKQKFVYPAKEDDGGDGSDTDRAKKRPPARKRSRSNGSPAECELEAEEPQQDGEGTRGKSGPLAGGEVGKLSSGLAKELEGIAQRLSEIAQDDGGNVDWSVERFEEVETAVLAVDKYAAELLRWLNGERPSVGQA